MIDMEGLNEQKIDFFLTDMKEKLRLGLLTDVQKKRLLKFYLSELFLESLENEEENEENMLKYMSLGWYIYQIKNGSI